MFTRVLLLAVAASATAELDFQDGAGTCTITKNGAELELTGCSLKTSNLDTVTADLIAAETAITNLQGQVNGLVSDVDAMSSDKVGCFYSCNYRAAHGWIHPGK
jgi:hypothetical protein